MRQILFAVLALASFLCASEPPKGLGALITTQMLDATTAVSFYEHGVSMSTLDPKTMEVATSYATADAPQLSTSWVSGGVTHTVTTSMPSTSPSNQQITQALARHKRIVDAMKALYPPAQP